MQLILLAGDGIAVGSEEHPVGKALDQLTEAAGLASEFSQSPRDVDREVESCGQQSLDAIEVLGRASAVGTDLARVRRRHHEGGEGIEQAVEGGVPARVAKPPVLFLQ